MKKHFDDFTHLYLISKTLRFELKPVGKTLDHINAKGFIDGEKKDSDIQRAEDYKKMKDIIDRYHKDYIERTLSVCSLPEDKLREYADLYTRKGEDEKAKEKIAKVLEALRKHIAKTLTSGKEYNRIFKKELIQEDLPAWKKLEKGDLETIEKFKNFTTYFSGFHENRKNMYSDEEQSTAIAYRLVNDNLPKFIDNARIYAEISAVDEIRENIKTLSNEFGIKDVDAMFNLPYFNHVLTQRQIMEYNAVIGAKTGEKEHKKGLNEYINQYNQQHKEARLPRLKPLFKQILSDRESLSWLPAAFENDEQVLQAVRTFYEDMATPTAEGSAPVLERLKTLLGSIGSYNPSGIFVRNDAQISDISQRMLGSWSALRAAIAAELKGSNALKKKRNESDEAFDDRIFTLVRKADSFSIRYLNDCLALTASQDEDEDAKRLTCVEEYFATLGEEKKDGAAIPDHFTRISDAYSKAEALLAAGTTIVKREEEGKENDVDLIKNLLDAFKDLLHFIKPLLGNGDESDKDERFYSDFLPLWLALDRLTPLYNMVRNYMTKKPYSDKKVRLYFENAGNFLGGWVDSKTEKSDAGTQYGGYLFRKKNAIGEYDYFLGVSANIRLFRRDNAVAASDDRYERLDYYQVKSQTIFGSSYEGKYQDDCTSLKECIKQFLTALKAPATLLPHSEGKSESESVPAYLKRLREADEQIYRKALEDDSCRAAYNVLRDKVRTALSTLTRVAEAVELSRRDDLSLEELMDAIFKIPSKLFRWFAISNEEMDKALSDENKMLHLFKITNKDLSYAETASKGLRKSRGTENLHTMYFKALMENGGNGVLDLGTGSVFYRERTDFGYSDDVFKHGHHYGELKDRFSYPIISNRRYAYDKFLFHLSFVINHSAPNYKAKDHNNAVRELLKEGGVEHIIGIDRGERHLLYLVVIDRHGRIVEQRSLNEIVNEYAGNTYRTNYHDLLDKREGDREEARRSWKTIENIKELKEGYLSQVVHQIAGLMVKYHAIVVLEDLNMGFMRGRQKVEKQVYQKFEKMLIDKLNYLVDKHAAPTAAGGLLNAYQLTSCFTSFRELGKQSGFLFYIPAWNTSKIDPATGFVNLLDTRYTNVSDSKTFFGKFDDIRYNAARGWFEFDIDYDKFGKKAEGTRTHWTICTHGERIDTVRDKETAVWKSETKDLTAAFKALFAEHGIDISKDLKKQIAGQEDKKFFEPLLHLLKLTLQMRNSLPGTETDYLVSPVADADGRFFDSRLADASMPANADANGAYNIARKGLMIVSQLTETPDVEKVKFDLSNKRWLQFAQDKPYEND